MHIGIVQRINLCGIAARGRKVRNDPGLIERVAAPEDVQLSTSVHAGRSSFIHGSSAPL